MASAARSILGAAHRNRVRHCRGRIWWIYGVMAVALAGYVVLLMARPVGQGSTAIDSWGVDVFELAAGGLCVIGGLRRRPGSAVPIILGLALGCWALGDLVLTVESLGGVTPPSPSVADVFYLLFFPLAYVAVFVLVRGETLRMSSPSWLDGAVAGLGAGAVCAAFAFAAVMHTAHESALASAVNLAYPVGDVLLLLLVVGGSAVMSGRRKAPWLLIVAGFAVNCFGDTSNLLHNSLGASQLGTIVNAIAWPMSSLMISMAMWLRPGPADPLAVPRSADFLLPGLAAGAGLVVLFLRALTPVNLVATGLATATLLLVVLRTWLSVRDLRAQSDLRHHQSVTDSLTGLANRRRLLDALAGYFAQAPDDRPELAFLFVDLNGFKRINDAFGHPVGDEVLKRVSARLAHALRPGDLLARLGGDEFAAMLVGADVDAVTAAAERLSTSLDQPFRFDSVSATISASIGISFATTDAVDGDGLVRCADAAMYRAKLASARHERYEPALDHGADKLRLADELAAAIDADELILHYQPQLDLRRDEITSVEALVRWCHPHHGIIAPAAFLPLAEEAGLMGKLTRWVLGQALGQCAAWLATGRRVRVSVNVSATDLGDPELPGAVAAILSRARVPAEWLILEVTETAIIDNFERAKRAVAELHELGVRISIDDFGAGFTSIAYLNDLQVDEMKLDRRFIAPLTAGISTRKAQLVGATIKLGHALGLDVVAEGIESTEALELLRALGCDIGQGDGISPPAPAAAVTFSSGPPPLVWTDGAEPVSAAA